MSIYSAAAQDATSCQPDALGTTQMTAQVIATRDGRSLTLADGRDIRLADIETPLSGAPAETARAALARMVDGRTVVLKQAGSGEDRYGRAQVYVFVADDARAGQKSAKESVQEQLVAQGYARVASRVAQRGCAASLLRGEQTARAARKGLWQDDTFSPRTATDADAVAAAAGRFAVLEGTVVSVRESRGVVYMNFGRRIARDFTVTILKRNERIFTAAGLEPRTLQGRRIRVRGFVERRRGPVIEATRAEQIELAELQ